MEEDSHVMCGGFGSTYSILLVGFAQPVEVDETLSLVVPGRLHGCIDVQRTRR
jgi:hypothetical protein